MVSLLERVSVRLEAERYSCEGVYPDIPGSGVTVSWYFHCPRVKKFGLRTEIVVAPPLQITVSGADTRIRAVGLTQMVTHSSTPLPQSAPSSSGDMLGVNR